MTIFSDIKKFVDINPRYYKFLKTINVTRNISQESCSLYDVELVLCKFDDDKIENLQLRCINAFDLKINDIEGMSGLLLNIEDISDRQIEGGIFLVNEIEEGTFSFYCEDFYVELLN